MVRLFTLLLMVAPLFAMGQYRNPLDLDISLAGNFGEIRPVSFHAGIDFKTGGVEGKKIYAAADGYVSRVAVSPWGYGKVVYITHPQLGSETVYAHISRFSGKIADLVRSSQYSRESFSTNIYLTANDIPVKQGDLIAYSGNTGSSGGPHLHFEVREGGVPINTIKKGYYKVADDIAPTIISLYVVRIAHDSTATKHKVVKRYLCEKVGSNYRIKDGASVEMPDGSYLAFEVTDRKNGVSNTFGIYNMAVTLDDNELFGFTIDKMPYTNMRYVNSLKLYPESNSTRNDILRAYRSPNNRLKIYDKIANRGIITHQNIGGGRAVATFTDDTGNSATLNFTLVPSDTQEGSYASPSGDIVEWMYPYHKEDSLYTIEIAEASLLESQRLEVSVDSLSTFHSAVVTVGSSDIPLMKSFKLKLLPKKESMAYKDKMVVVSINSKGGKSALDSSFSGEFLECSPSRFGRFAIAIDTTAPKITPKYNPAEAQQRNIAFKITDDLSGISIFRGLVDGKWVLFDYEPKTNTITYNFDDRITKGGKHTISLVVIDSKNNKKKYNGEFIY